MPPGFRFSAKFPETVWSVVDCRFLKMFDSSKAQRNMLMFVRIHF